MRAYLNTAPRWILSLVYGLPFGAVMAIGIVADNSSGAGEIVAFGLVAGVVFGICLTFATEKQRREIRAVIGDVPASELGTVFRAARRGPVPADPEIRAAALRLATHEAAQAWIASIVGIPIALLVVAGAVFRRDDIPLLPVLAAIAVAGVAYQWYVLWQLRRQVKLLPDADQPV
jgi:hypothetical protein